MTNAVLDDWTAADVPPRLKAGLTLVSVLAKTPDALGRDHLDAARAAGISDAAIRDLAYVVALFSWIVRVADALHWDVPDDFSGSATMLVKHGYKLPPFL